MTMRLIFAAVLTVALLAPHGPLHSETGGAAIRSSSTAARSCCWTAEAPAQSRGHRARAVEIRA